MEIGIRVEAGHVDLEGDVAVVVGPWSAVFRLLGGWRCGLLLLLDWVLGGGGGEGCGGVDGLVLLVAGQRAVAEAADGTFVFGFLGGADAAEGGGGGGHFYSFLLIYFLLFSRRVCNTVLIYSGRMGLRQSGRSHHVCVFDREGSFGLEGKEEVAMTL